MRWQLEGKGKKEAKKILENVGIEKRQQKKNTARVNSWKDRARMNKIKKKKRMRISCVNRSIIIGQKEHGTIERKFSNGIPL